MDDGANNAPAWLTAHRAGLILAALVLGGLAFRLAHVGDSVFGDETSTLYVVRGGLGETVSTVATDAEISPPLYFVLAWLAAQFGSAPELIRLPALLAGIASIPLTYLVGARAVGRAAGLIAAAAMTLSPFMVSYSVNARVYSLAIALLLGSTLAMLIAIRGGRRGGWIAYGALSCLAMYAHYTAAFVLIAQLGWLLWAHPREWKPALVANAGAALLFVPWVPSMLSDLGSPTTTILERLQGDGFAIKRVAVEVWAFGSPGASLDQVPGTRLLHLATIALAVAVLVGLARALRRYRATRAPESRAAVSRGMVLLVALALATPVAEAGLVLLGGPDLFGARNLNTSSGGLALAIGGVLAAAGPLIGTLCAVAVLATFAAGSVRALDDTASTFNFKGPAGLIDAEGAPGDVVIDAASAAVTPTPLTPLAAHITTDIPQYPFYLPEGPAPFLGDPLPAAPIVSDAFRAAGGHRVFVVSLVGGTSVVEADGRLGLRVTPPPDVGAPETLPLGAGARVTEEETFEGLAGIRVTTVEVGRDHRRAGGSRLEATRRSILSGP